MAAITGHRDAIIIGAGQAGVPLARALDETRGMTKVVVEAETDRMLGCAVLGVEGGEIMAALQIAMMGGLPYTALRDAVFAHQLLPRLSTTCSPSYRTEPAGAEISSHN